MRLPLSLPTQPDLHAASHEMGDGVRLPVPPSSVGQLGYRLDTPSGIAWQWQLKRDGVLTPARCLYCCIGVAALNALLGMSLVSWGYPGALYLLGLEGLFVLACMLTYAVHGRDGETITLQNQELTVEVQIGGRFRRTVLRADSVRIDAQASGPISLSEHGFKMELGRHVQPRLREAMRRELRHALHHGHL